VETRFLRGYCEEKAMFNRQSLHIALLLWGCIFSLIAALCMLMSRNFDREKRKYLLLIQLTTAVLLLNDAIAWAYRGSMEPGAAVLVRISNFLVFACSDIVMFWFHCYLCCCLFREKSRLSGIFRKDSEQQTEEILKKREEILPVKRILAVYVLMGLGVVMVILSQFTHWYYYIDAANYYHRNAGYVISLLLPVLGMGIDLTLLIQYRRKISREIFVAMLFYLLLPLLAAIFLLFYYGISLVNIAISISVVLMFVTATMEQNQNLAKKEQEAADMRIAIMLSQIAPHFIYNTLSTINYLCKKNPEMAQQTIVAFSDYLRGNLDSLSEKKTVEFQKELKHIQCYCQIEELRFEDRLQVKYDIGTEDFQIPSLSVQPLVENAIKHGVCRKAEGGTVIIRTRQENGSVTVQIEDDGVGFDVKKIPDDGRLHVGIMNVRERVERMCHGSLTVESEPGKGTLVTIRIPKTEEQE